jgi:hypothetical protein
MVWGFNHTGTGKQDSKAWFVLSTPWFIVQLWRFWRGLNVMHFLPGTLIGFGEDPHLEIVRNDFAIANVGPLVLIYRVKT